jgi:HlyD family secretion protein
VTYRTEAVTKGDSTSGVTSTGNLEPVDVIDVGTQVAGIIESFGTDANGQPIDYGSPVNPGTVLAKIDESLFKAKVEQSESLLGSAKQKVVSFKAKVDQAKAKVDQAKANTLRAEADVDQAVAKLNQASRDWDRIRKVGAGSVSQSDLDAAEAAFETNKAGVAVAKAAVTQAKAMEPDAAAAVIDAQAAVADAQAAVRTAEATLKLDRINLGYCTIKSPVKGIIVDRRITIGQTVQSSFNTPSLFLIAKDLSTMKVWASVNEADVNQVRVGQTVKFTVDAEPGRTFTGTVNRIRLNATNTQNVVVYTVEILVDNKDGKLKPYFTAYLQFEVAKRTDAILIPNGALRYRPSGQAAQGGGDKAGHGTVWVDDGGTLRSVSVKLGITDGTHTEVLDGDLKPGTLLVVGEIKATAGDSGGGQNPFATKFRSKKKE